MSRPYLIRAREERDLSQQDVADLIQTARSLISSWETGVKTPDPYQRRKLREILHRPVDQYPHLFDVVTETSPTRLGLIMEQAKRETLRILGLILPASVLPAYTVQIVTEPQVSTEEYINQAETVIKACWQLLSTGQYQIADDLLNTHVSSLGRFINTSNPFQAHAAALGVDFCIQKICISKQRLDYTLCRRYCTLIEEYAVFADDPVVLAIAQDWQADTYSSFFHQSHTAVPILLKAIKNAEGNELLTSSIYSLLSRSYARWDTEAGFEGKARKYSEMAYNTFPSLPETDMHYQQIQMSASELYQFDVWTNIELARTTKNNKYAVKAFDMLNTLMQAPMNVHYTCSLHKSTADIAALLGYKDVFLDNMEKSVNIAKNMQSARKLNGLNKVISYMPKEWKTDSTIQDLQREIGKALIVVPR